MPQLLPLSRAARLVGVSRGELQSRIRNNELATFEGKVLITDLLRVYPEIDMNTSPMLERVEQIKAAAMPKVLQEGYGLPPSDVLLSRLEHLTHVLVEMKSNLNRQSELLQSMAQRLKAVNGMQAENLRGEIQQLYEWLRQEMESQPAEPDSSAQLFVKDTFLRIMAAHVKIIPSGHEFFVEGAASIMDAAIRAGLNLSYGCTNASCGLCKARVISGDVWKIREHDYILSEREKNIGYILICANTAITDLVLEAAEAATAEDLPAQTIHATVRRLENLSDDRLILHLQTPKSQTLRFMAGQRAKLVIAGELSATYPIASCPCDGHNLQFIIHNIPDNHFTETVFTRLKPSQNVAIRGPEGNFVLEDDSTRPILFIALDDGFAPMRSLIEHAISIDCAESLYLYWLVDQNSEHYMDSLCRSWRDALDNFYYTPLKLENDDDSNQKTYLRQYLIDALEPVITDHDDLSGFDAYVAGSESFAAIVADVLHDYRLLPTHLRVEVTG